MISSFFCGHLQHMPHSSSPGVSYGCLLWTQGLTIDPSHKSHNALGKYLTMHHFVTEMYTQVHICYNNVALWDVWDWCIVGFVRWVYWATFVLLYISSIGVNNQNQDSYHTGPCYILWLVDKFDEYHAVALKVKSKSKNLHVKITAILQTAFSSSFSKIKHDDVIKWKHFPRFWPFVREFTGPRWIATQRPMTRSFDVFFDLRLYKRLSKQWWGWWFDTLSRPLWRHRNELLYFHSNSTKLCSQGSINNTPALVQIMAWCRTGAKPLFEPMMA